MNSLFALIIVPLTFILAGAPWTRLVKKLLIQEFVALSFIIGSGITTFLWFLLYLFGLSLDMTSLGISVGLSYLIGSLFAGKAHYPFIKTNSISNTYKVLLALAVISLIIALYNPVTAWDALTLYDFRGSVIAATHSLSSIEIGTYYLSYPLLTSLAHAFVYMLGGSSPNFFYSLLYLSLVMVVYARTLFATDQKHAVLAALLVATSPFIFEHSTIAYTNLPYTAFLTIAVLYAPSSLALSGVALGLSVWTRTAEPFWILGIAYLCYIAWQNKNWKELAKGFLSFAIIKYAWSLYLHNVYVRNSFDEGGSSVYNLDMLGKVYANLPRIVRYFYEFIFTPHIGVFVLLIAILILYLKLGIKKYDRVLPSFLFCFSLFAMVVIGIAVFSTYYSSWYSIGGSATRMMICIIPVSVVTGVKFYYQQQKYDKNK